MDPLTAGLFVAANFAVSVASNRSQARIQEANIKLQTEQARTQAADAAYQRTRSFRENMATNLALSGVGVGGLTGARGVIAQNTTDYFNDINALNKQDLFSVLQSQSNKAANKAIRSAGDVTAAFNAAKLASDLGLFQSKGVGKKKNAGT